MGCRIAKLVLLIGAIATVCIADKLVDKRAEESEDDVLRMPSDLGNEEGAHAITEYHIHFDSG